MTTWRRRIYDFFFAPASAQPLAALRISLSAVLLIQAFFLAGDLQDLYGRSGILQGGLTDYLQTLALPNIEWLQNRLAAFGVSPAVTVRSLFFVYLASLTTLLLGWHTRLSTLVAWLTHFIVIVSGFTLAYGVDHFANIFLYFLIWMPAGNAWSLDERHGAASVRPTAGARFALRVLQLELCVVYLSSGIYKAMGIQWWNGEAIWRSVTLPMPRLVDAYWLASVPRLAATLGWATLVVELGYVFFIWPKRTRKIWVGATLAMHFGIALSLGLVSFAAVMMLLTGSLFGVSAEAEVETAPQGARLNALVGTIA